MFREPSSSCMMFAFGFACSIVSRIDFRSTVPMPSGRIAAHVRTVDEILQVHVHGDRREVLDDLRRVGAAFLQLTDVGGELEDPRVDAFHDRIDLVARFDRGTRVLVQARAHAEIGQALP